MENKEWLDRYLLSVEKPSRYLGNEINSVSPCPGDFKVALAFPDAYEIGMSYLGLKILYEILNSRDGVVAERVFSPWGDMEKLLRSQGRPLFSLESKTPLSQFDIVGITLPYELCYTNLLNIIDLGGIPLEAHDRGEDDPLVIGGGAAVFNPEVVADFFDLFFLGDAEEGIVELVDCCRSAKAQGKSRFQTLHELSEIQGVYIPSLYSVEYDSSGRIKEITGPSQNPERRIIENLDGVPCSVRPPVPYCAITHDRYTMEISRGCTRGCRFCQAGMTYRPVREHSVEKIGQLTSQGIASTGYGDLSLASLSSGDYSDLPGLFDRLEGFEQLAVSFPSLRVGSLDQNSIDFIKRFRKTGFTIAPEAGTQRLRQVINKGITQEEILDTVRLIFDSGWEGIKLYFMIGLPTETHEDLEGIVKLAGEISQIAKRSSGRRKFINLAVSAFTPKPHTPFQWCPSDQPEETRRKLDFIKRSLPRNIRLKWQNPEVSYLENIMSRGDRRLGRVVKTAWELGARYDGWDEFFSLDIWLEAFKTQGVNPDDYARRSFDMEEILPWDHLEVGPAKTFLQEEWQKAIKEQPTGDCRLTGCLNCGVCQRSGIPVTREKPVTLLLVKGKEKTGGHRINAGPGEAKLRLQYHKLGDIRFISHLDLINALIRAFRRAEIPMAYSQGFHPHPKLSFCLPLSLGVESSGELCDVQLKQYIPVKEFIDRLNGRLPEGLKIIKAEYLSDQNYKLSEISDRQVYEACFRLAEGGKRTGLTDFLRARVEDIQGSSDLTLVFQKPGRPPKKIDLKPFLDRICLKSESTVEFVLFSVSGGSLSPFKLMSKFMDSPEGDRYSYVLRRTVLSSMDPYRKRRSGPLSKNKVRASNR